MKYGAKGKTRLAVTDALNGDIDKVDAAVRRALFAVSTELDEHAVAMDVAHIEIMETMQENVTKLEKSINQIRALLITTTGTFLVAMLTGFLNLILN